MTLIGIWNHEPLANDGDWMIEKTDDIIVRGWGALWLVILAFSIFIWWAQKVADYEDTGQ